MGGNMARHKMWQKNQSLPSSMDDPAGRCKGADRNTVRHLPELLAKWGTHWRKRLTKKRETCLNIRTGCIYGLKQSNSKPKCTCILYLKLNNNTNKYQNGFFTRIS